MALAALAGLPSALGEAMKGKKTPDALPDYLAKHGVLGIEGVDTRALTLHIRTAGAMKAAISTEGRSEEELVQMARDWEGLVGRDLITKVGCTERRV